MKRRLFRPLSVIAALLINAGIIIAIPQMSGTLPAPLAGEHLRPVLLTEYHPRSPEAEKKTEKEEWNQGTMKERKSICPKFLQMKNPGKLQAELWHLSGR